MDKLTGKPLTAIGRFFDGNAHAEFIAKSFLAGYGAQVVFTFTPLVGNPQALIILLTHIDFDLTFFNDAFGKALVVAWGLILTSPYDSTSTPTTLSPGVRPVDANQK